MFYSLQGQQFFAFLSTFASRIFFPPRKGSVHLMNDIADAFRSQRRWKCLCHVNPLIPYIHVSLHIFWVLLYVFYHKIIHSSIYSLLAVFIYFYYIFKPETRTALHWLVLNWTNLGCFVCYFFCLCFFYLLPFTKRLQKAFAWLDAQLTVISASFNKVILEWIVICKLKYGVWGAVSLLPFYSRRPHRTEKAHPGWLSM